MARRQYEVISFDNKYYATDGVIEDVLDVVTSKKRAEALVSAYKAQATPTPWTGFYWREKTETHYYIEIGYGFCDRYGWSTTDYKDMLRARSRDDIREIHERIYGMDGRLISDQYI